MTGGKLAGSGMTGSELAGGARRVATGLGLDFDPVPPSRAPVGAPVSGHAVVVTGLVKRYRTTEAVRGLDLVAPAGAVTALLGPNGAGKTTAVECCEGLRRPDGGSVRVLGLDPTRDRRALRPRVGVMLQDGGLPGTVPAGAALAHVAAMYARPRDLAELTGRLGLDSCARTPVRRLSGGQRQRLALAAAVVGRPELLFLDEPSAGMDPQARLAVWDLVRELRGDGVSILVTTHGMAEAEALADHVVVVDHGRAIAAGTLAQVVGDGATVRVVLSPHGGRAPLPDDVAAARLAAHLSRVLRQGAGAGHRPVRVTPSGAHATLEVHAAADPVVLHAVTEWALHEGQLVVGLSTGRRTLEDVFLELTGRSLR